MQLASFDGPGEINLTLRVREAAVVVLAIHALLDQGAEGMVEDATAVVGKLIAAIDVEGGDGALSERSGE
jgi:hypothetical protein